MASRTVIALAILLAGCGRPWTPPLVRAPGPSTMAPAPVRAASSVPVAAPADVPSILTRAEPDLDVAVAPPLLPPDDAICFVRGSGDPFSSGCRTSVAVTRRRDGREPVGTFNPVTIDATWAFFEGKGRSWVGVTSAGLRLTGFVDTHAQRFRLARTVAAIDGHVWLDEGAPVVVRRGTKEGLELVVVDDTPGVDVLSAEAGCDALLFDPEPAADRRAAKAQRQKAKPSHWAAPKRPVLPIRIEPHGRVVTTLHLDDSPLPLSVDMKESREGFTRILFMTASAHFDVWVASSELTTQSGRGVGGAGASCGRVRRGYGPAKLFEVDTVTPVLVARSPKLGMEGTEGVSATSGSSFRVQRRENGFAEIVAPFGAIDPPEGLSFWVPETALHAHAESALP